MPKQANPKPNGWWDWLLNLLEIPLPPHPKQH